MARDSRPHCPETYGVTLTDDEIERHFGPEQAMTPWHLVLWLLGKMSPLEPLTVDELHARVKTHAAG